MRGFTAPSPRRAAPRSTSLGPSAAPSPPPRSTTLRPTRTTCARPPVGAPLPARRRDSPRRIGVSSDRPSMCRPGPGNVLVRAALIRRQQDLRPLDLPDAATALETSAINDCRSRSSTRHGIVGSSDLPCVSGDHRARRLATCRPSPTNKGSIWPSSMPIHRRPPAEADFRAFVRVMPPTMHQMILALAQHGYIRRQPGQARSIELLVAPEDLPILR